MRIREDARRCSVFLGYGDPSDPSALKQIEGTGFFVAHGGEAYLVTAGHVARTLSGGPFAVRMTGSDDLGRVMDIDHPKWKYHGDTSNDIAVMLVDPPDWTITTAMPSTEFVDDRRMKDWEIGPGDAVYLVGLFHLHPGKKRNLPVVHAGNIALMPSDEKLPVKKSSGRGLDHVHAYLVEAQALPGASGSPVMLRPTVRFMAKEESDKQDSLAIAEGRDFLLGVWIAAWPGAPNKAMRGALGISERTWIPVGMGIVVPAQRLKEILERDDMERERQSKQRGEEAARAASPSGAASPRPDRGLATKADIPPTDAKRFTALVNAAARKRKQDD